MAKTSAGILVYRIVKKQLQVFLAHPGGPFWKNKDDGGWTIIKGEINDDENPEQAAKREFEEETGWIISGELISLQPVKQKSGKIVHAWAVNMNTAAGIKSNSFTIEWPPRSGKMQSFPEIDRAEWFTIAEAQVKINPAQSAFLDELGTILRSK